MASISLRKLRRRSHLVDVACVHHEDAIRQGHRLERDGAPVPLDRLHLFDTASGRRVGEPDAGPVAPTGSPPP
ncbi:MAG: hypothetical protein ACJ8G1_29505 [Vitreoscilla sp.]